MRWEVRLPKSARGVKNAFSVRWRVEDIIGGDKRLDFKRPFLPESLARVDSMDFLTSQEKLLFNQIRGLRISVHIWYCRFDPPPYDLLVEKQILREIKQCDS